jgi:uncharacterized membrane protein YidH (DUF202 family)
VEEEGRSNRHQVQEVLLVVLVAVDPGIILPEEPEIRHQCLHHKETMVDPEAMLHLVLVVAVVVVLVVLVVPALIQLEEQVAMQRSFLQHLEIHNLQ